ncbi:hypothetical protein [Kribbella italica]|uniref:Uncharacterized protein n=1 Tax=Kribbella italica TaxID=1540520 RepID=A0A7W9MYX2_9ACTN|nr:hypothetical protein [Kribbella italica]MBB5840618.1 hypothetical protein [Kribbella italica]
MSGRTVKVSIAEWLSNIVGSCTDQLNGEFSDDELAHLKNRHDKLMFGAYLMGTSDNAVAIRALLESAHLGDRKVSIPEGLPQTPETPGTRENPTPLTIGTLRAFLACRTDLSDDLPVVVGGVDIDDNNRELSGLADAIWSDTEGTFGGRICISARSIGLVD